MFCLLIHRTPVPVSPQLPDPNGYDDLMRAGKLAENKLNALGKAGKIRRTTRSHPSTGSDAELRELTSECAEVLAVARVGLDRRCQMPWSLSRPPTLDILFPLRALDSVFGSEGDLAKREGRVADAARSYADIIRLGYSMSRGGQTADAFMGVVVSNSGITKLRSVSRRLTSNQSAELAREIERLESNAERAADILARDFAGIDLQCDWQFRVIVRMNRTERIFRGTYGLRCARTRLLICEFALYAYHLDQGAWPGQLGDLVPEYLSKVPADPFTGQPITYRRIGRGYRLGSSEVAVHEFSGLSGPVQSKNLNEAIGL